MAERMVELASEQPGFLGVESAREEVGITVSYWSDLESIKAWKANIEHLDAQKLGHENGIHLSGFAYRKLNVITGFNKKAAS